MVMMQSSRTSSLPESSLAEMAARVVGRDCSTVVSWSWIAEEMVENCSEGERE